MGEIFSALVSFLIIIGIVVAVHEFGHFITARVLGVQVHEFAIGMGPVIKQFEQLKEVKKDNQTYKYRTLWSLRAFPLGGFCRLAGMGAEDEETASTVDSKDKKSKSFSMGEEYDDQPVIPGMGFNEQSAWKRFFILLNGSVCNVILALILVTALLSGRGVLNMNDTRIGTLLDGFPAQSVGFQPGDRITEVNGVRVTEWREMQTRLREAATYGDVTFTIERGNSVLTITTALSFSEEHGNPMLGITPAMIGMPLHESLVFSVFHIRDMTIIMLMGIRDMVTGRGEVDVTGPIGIASMSGQAMRDGVWSFVTLMALISLNIGLLNLFPIPALDGGRIIFVFLEMIFRRRLPEKIENYIHTAGAVLLISLIVLITWQDIYNIFFAG